MLRVLKYYITLAGFISLAVFGSVQTTKLHGVQIELASELTRAAQEQAAVAAKLADAQGKLRQAEQKLSATTFEIRKETNEKVQSLVVQRDGLLKRVRRAEAAAATNSIVSRIASDTGDGKAIPGNIGAEFLESLGTTDVEEASRADVIRNQLIACYKQYDSVRESLNQTRK